MFKCQRRFKTKNKKNKKSSTQFSMPLPDSKTFTENYLNFRAFQEFTNNVKLKLKRFSNECRKKAT